MVGVYPGLCISFAAAFQFIEHRHCVIRPLFQQGNPGVCGIVHRHVTL
jgi:hypothetical protein